MTPDRPTDPHLRAHAHATRRAVREQARAGHVQSASAPSRGLGRWWPVAVVVVALAVAYVLLLVMGR